MFFRKLTDAVKEVVDDVSKGLKEIADDASGKKTVPDETETLPVKCTIQVKSNRYKRLSMHKRVEVSSKKEYEKLKGNILNEFRDKYGVYYTQSGKSVKVWSDKAFKEVVKTIAFEDSNLVDALKKHGKW